MTSIVPLARATSLANETFAWSVELTSMSAALEPSAIAEALRLGVRLTIDEKVLVARFAVSASSLSDAAIAANRRWLDACERMSALPVEIDQIQLRRVRLRRALVAVDGRENVPV